MAKTKVTKTEDRPGTKTVASKGGFYVRAVLKGQSPDGQIREPGEVFFLADAKFFSDAHDEKDIVDDKGKKTGRRKRGWMERVETKAGVHEIAIEKAKDNAAIANTVPGTGDDDVI